MTTPNAPKKFKQLRSTRALMGLAKDRLRRKRFQNIEHHYLLLRSLFFNQRLPFKFRLYVHRRLGLLSRRSSLVQIRNRCILTGRSRGVYRFFGLSRFQFKALAAQGYLTGVELASW